MKVEILPKEHFQHGRQDFTRGVPEMVSQADADGLVDAGLAERTGGTAPDDMDELLGVKMEPVTSNKMGPAPANKSAQTKQAPKK